MSKIIFTSGIDPAYDDIPEVRCEFPQRYFKAITEAVGDWVIYYEPRKNGGRMSYYASAKITKVEQHPTKKGSYYMFVSDYLEFQQAVPYRDGTSYMEVALKGDGVKPNLGALRWSVRRLPEHEFSAILSAGFKINLLARGDENYVDEEQSTYAHPIVQRLTNRPFRDRAFSDKVHEAYGETCALTGLKLHNGDRLYEVHAAHIRAVEDKGPDSPRNGLALGQTVHWLFDRGVISLEDDGKILKAGHLVPQKIESLFHRDGYARFPDQAHLKPHPQFLRFHRENRYIG